MTGRQASARLLAKILMLDVARSIRDSGRAVIRVWGFVLPLLVVFTQAVFGTWSRTSWAIMTWTVAYLLCALLLAIGIFASAAAWAIERARAIRRLQELQRRTEAFLISVSRELAKSCGFDAIGEIAVRAGAELIGAEGCSLYIIKDKLLELTHSSHLAGTKYIGMQKPVRVGPGCGLVAWVAATGRTLRLRDGEHRAHPAWAGEEAYLRDMQGGGCKSLLITPLVASDGRMIGVLYLENKTGPGAEKGFEQNDEDTLRFVAEQVTLAIEKVGLFKTAEKWERIGLEDDLHELINLYQAGVVLSLESMEEWYRRGQFERVTSMLPKTVRHARSVLFELKTIHSAVFSRYMETDTIETGLRRLASAWEKRASYPVSIEIEVDTTDTVPASMRNSLVRIANGAIGNAILHSGADESPNVRIWIKLVQRGDQLLLEVGDSGKGMEPSAKEGYGISRMRRLAQQMNSDLKIDSVPGGGTKVRVYVFLKRESL